MKRFDVRNNKKFCRKADAVCTVVALMLSLRLTPTMDDAALTLVGAGLFLALAASRVFEALSGKGVLPRGWLIKEQCCVGVYLACALLFLFVRDAQLLLRLSVIVFYAVVCVNRWFSLAAPPRKLRKIVLNGGSILLIVCGLVLLFLWDEAGLFNIIVFVLTMTLKALFHIIAVSFSQIKLAALRRIVRKTYVAEILFGLLLLIVSFSSYFQAMEPGIETYLDALWYCFAVVTTIGFGDFSVVMPVSRFLSVILGIYGIVVVALITSVIVNFYGEVRNEKDEEQTPPDEK